jgi:hypothetical protein
MQNEEIEKGITTAADPASSTTNNKEATPNKTNISRRSFLGRVGTVAGVAAASGAMTVFEPLIGGESSKAHANEIGPLDDATRADASLAYRTNIANANRALPLVSHPCNGDETLYVDKCATFTKTLVHDSFGRVDLSTSYPSFINALTTGSPADFNAIVLGGPRHLTNPQGGLAFDPEGTDGHNFTVPPAPTMAGPQTAAEMVEMYWASLLRDVNFTQYATSATAIAAAAELNLLPAYAGPRNGSNVVTTNELFRGSFPGETVGPYVSQLMLQPTNFGNQPISQKFITFVKGIDFMTDFPGYVTVQNGGNIGQSLQYDAIPRYLRNGRDMSAWTHVDVLYQGYLVAFLVLAGMGAPLNPGNPYLGSTTQDGFATFGGPDFAATIGEVATRALKAVWFQKWFVHRRARPEVPGALTQLVKTGQGGMTNCTMDSSLLNSQALLASFHKNSSYLLSQAFPEGSPTHPSYPTGHGTVGGACITILKFFFDGNFVIPHPVVPTVSGTGLTPYVGPALTVQGELNKLGHNITFGHGIHPAIHYRSDSDASLLLGEQVALSILQDKAAAYNEKFSVTLTKFDGTLVTISN